jgi:two-component system phosphate regulon sensor histidine kinase PhoR
MLRSRLLWKLYAGYVVLIVLTALVIGILVARRMEQDSRRETEAALRAKAVFLADLVAASEDASPAGLEARLRRLGTDTQVRLTVIGSGGTVLADSEEDPARMDNHADRPEIASARERGFGTSTRYSHTLRVDMMYVALPIRRDGALLGFARAALPLTAIDQRLAHARATVLLGAAIAIAAGTLLGFIFARRLIRPLLAVTRAAEAIANGNYDLEVRPESKDEIGKLVHAFNRMAEHLRERMDTITKDRNQVLAILAGMVEGVVAVDREGRVVHLNEVAGSLLHVSPQASLGRPIREVTQVPAVVEMLSGTSADGATLTRELRLPERPKDRIIEVRASPLRDARSEPAGSVIVLHDITELRRLEQVRRDFVASVSHELKTPLTAIRGLIETLIDDPDMTAETHRRFLGKVRDQTARLSNLVTDLLTLSRVESEEGAVERERLDLREPVGESARALGPAGEAKGLTLETQMPAAPVAVLGDREALRQIVDNLLDNAIKYTPAGGRIWLRIRPEADSVVVEVEDSGCGIEPQHQDRIFERFYRVDKARSRELGGTGLGLSIVKHFALALGGQVSVASVPGQGSTFRVRLPRITSA